MAPGVTAALSLVPAALQLGTSILQGRESRRFDSGDRPAYMPPEAAVDALNLAKHRARRTTLPGQDFLEESLSQTTANTVDQLERFAPSSVAGSQMAVKAFANELAGKRDIGFKAAQMSDRREQDLIQAMDLFAQYQDKGFELNELQPYLDSMASSSAMGNASMINRYESIKDIAGVLAMMSANGGSGGAGGDAVGGFRVGAPEPLSSIPTPKARDILANAGSSNMGFVDNASEPNPYKNDMDSIIGGNDQVGFNQFGLQFSPEMLSVIERLSGLQESLIPSHPFIDTGGISSSTQMPILNF